MKISIRSNRVNHAVFIPLLFLVTTMSAQNLGSVMQGIGSPLYPKINIGWNRYYDAEQLWSFCKTIAVKYPKLVKWETIGKSSQGRDILALTITDFTKGKPSAKPGVYIQGNLHGNEIQGGEAALYIAWYLTENFSEVKFVRELLEDKIFYIVPTINPDARDFFFHHPSRSSQPRYTLLPFDADGDGKMNEDGCDDLDGDGNITEMRKKNLYGIYVKDKVDPRLMTRLADDSLLFQEGRWRAKRPSEEHYDVMTEGGIDNDGDGKIDEDGIISDSIIHHYRADLMKYDPNRNWGWSRDKNDKDDVVKFAFSLAEVKAAKKFILNHPNIAFGISFHNWSADDFYTPAIYKNMYYSQGKQIRIDSTFFNEKTHRSDAMIFDSLLSFRKKIFSGNVAKYDTSAPTLNGREIDWMYGVRGFYSFLPEIGFFGRWITKDNFSGNMAKYVLDFSDAVTFETGYVQWHEVAHPVYGKVEVGGEKKNFSGFSPGFALEDELHRLASFIIHCSNETSKLEIKSFTVTDKGNGIDEIEAVIANTRLMPTHSAQDLRHQIQPPDIIRLVSNGSIITAEPAADAKGEMMIENIPGHSEVKVRWTVKRNSGKYKVVVESVKGGRASAVAQSN